MEDQRERAKSQLRKLDGLSDRVKNLMADIVDSHNVSCGQDLVSALTKSEQFPEKVHDLNQKEAAELDTHLLAMLVDQHYKTQRMVDSLNSRLEAKMDAMDDIKSQLSAHLDGAVKVKAEPPTAPAAPGPGGLFSFNPFAGIGGGNVVVHVPDAPTAPGVHVKVEDPAVAGGPEVPREVGQARGFFFNPFDSTPPSVAVNVAKGAAPEGHVPGAPHVPHADALQLRRDGHLDDPDMETPPTPLLDWILGINPNNKKRVGKLPLIVILVVTTAVRAVPVGIEHDYTVTAINTHPDEIKRLLDDAILSGGFTRTLKEAGFPNASATAPVKVTDKTPEKNPLQRTVVDVTQVINGLTISDTKTPAFRSGIGGTVPRLAAALPAEGAEDFAPSQAPPMVILDFSLTAIEPDRTSTSEVTAKYQIMALNTTPAELAAVVDNAVRCGAFTRSIRAAGFPTAKCADKVAVTDATPEVNPLKKTVLDISQRVTGVTSQEANAPSFKLALGDSVASAPSMSLQAPDIDEMPEVEPPTFDFDVLIPKWTSVYAAFGGGPSLAPPATDAPTVGVVAGPGPMRVVRTVYKSATPAPVGGGGVVIVYDVTAENGTPKELTDVVNGSIRSGAFTQALARAGYPHALAVKPATDRDVTPKECPAGRVVVEYTQTIDRLTADDVKAPAFKSALAGHLMWVARPPADPAAPPAPLPPVIVSVVVKHLTPAPGDGVEVLYAVTALHATKESLTTAVNKAVSAGYFTALLRQSGYPRADAHQKIATRDATPSPNPTQVVVVEVTQAVDGVTADEARRAEFGTAFGDIVAQAPSVSPHTPDVEIRRPVVFSFGEFVEPIFAPFRGSSAPAGDKDAEDAVPPPQDAPHGHPRSRDVEPAAGPEPPRPLITKVSTFSVGPLPFGKGVLHGFLVTAQDATPEVLTQTINTAIKAKRFDTAFQGAGFPDASAPEPLDIADDMTKVYHPKENPLGRTVLYCQHRIENMTPEDTKKPAFRSTFGGVIARAADPYHDWSEPHLVIHEAAMIKFEEIAPGKACRAEYRVVSSKCSPAQLKDALDAAAKQGVFTQALKDAGFSGAVAGAEVEVTDVTATTVGYPATVAVARVVQTVEGVTPAEGSTPSFDTALGAAVAFAPSVSSVKPRAKIQIPVDAPKTKAPGFAFPWSTTEEPHPMPMPTPHEEHEKAPPGPTVGERFASMAAAVPKMTIPLPTIHLLDPTYFHHLDPPARQGGAIRGSMSARTMTMGMENPLKAPAKFLMGGEDEELPSGGGSLRVEILPTPKPPIPGLLQENDGRDDDDELGGEEEHDDDHAVTGHLFYDIYKAMALG